MSCLSLIKYTRNVSLYLLFLISISISVIAGPGQNKCGFISDRDSGAVPWTSENINTDSSAFHFAVVSDRTGGERPGVFESAIEKANLLQPAFVMSIGDLIQGYSDSVSQAAAEWRAFDSIIAALDMPFFRVCGNHDIKTRANEKYWNENYGLPYYHFVFRNVLFLCAATTVNGDTAVFDSTQCQYFSNILKKYPESRYTFLFMHHPLWIYSENRGWNMIKDLLKNRNVTVFAGHLHKFMREKSKINDKTGMYVLATTGGRFNKKAPDECTFDHFVWVAMTDNGPFISSIKLKGIRDIDSLPACGGKNSR